MNSQVQSPNQKVEAICVHLNNRSEPESPNGDMLNYMDKQVDDEMTCGNLQDLGRWLEDLEALEKPYFPTPYSPQGEERFTKKKKIRRYGKKSNSCTTTNPNGRLHGYNRRFSGGHIHSS